MRQWLIGAAIVGLLAAGLLLGGFIAGTSAQGSPPSQTPIPPEEAAAAALEAYPGAIVIEIELERERDTLSYEVELDNGRQVLVDPHDGSILGTGQETADDPDDGPDGLGNEIEEADVPGDLEDAGPVAN